MKRVVRSKSGREVYGPKWQNNMESSNNFDAAQVSDATLPPPVTATNAEDQTQSSEEAPPVTENHMEYSNISDASDQLSVAIEAPPVTEINAEDQTQSSEGINRRRNLSNHHQSMYKACLLGDCVSAEMLLGEDPDLLWDEISEEGDRALHVAAAMKHRELVQKLVERMSPRELALLDGRGYTACCYAAISADSVEIADFMMRKNSTLATARDKENKTPLQKAASCGNANMVSYFIEYAKAKAEDLSTQEWFDLLLVTIHRNMYGVGLEILGINEQLATMSNDQGTALHLLAKQRFFIYSMLGWQYMKGVMQREMRLLAKKLWEGVQTLGQSSAVELMKKPPILHNAAEEGNIELMTMLTHTYPALIWLTDTKGYTIFHIAVIHRHERLFALINEIGTRKDLIAVWQDEDGNNILHLVGKLGAQKRRIMYMPTFEMLRQMLWFQKVRDIVPPMCLEMKNKEGQTARELFLKTHEKLLEESRTWMRNVSDSCMLISTLIFTVVFGSAFAVPGGYNQETGIPILIGKKWFTCFVIFEALAMLSSTFSMLCFLRIMMTGSMETRFSMAKMTTQAARSVPNWFVWGLDALSFSVLAAVSVFMSAYFLVHVGERAVLVVILIIVVYVVIVSVVSLQIYVLHIYLPKYRFRKLPQHTLFK